MAQKRQSDRPDTFALKRYCTGVTVLCITVSLISSAIAGLAPETIILRGMMVALGSGVVAWIVQRSWVVWARPISGEKRKPK